ncbi:MAG: hypothetical protein AAB390_02250 [Patescibacteria group bacterium]
MNKKNLVILLQTILFAGVIFSWYTVYQDFGRFYAQEGTLFKIKDCVAPNPVTTPCFYGAFAFLGAFVWSLLIPKMAEEKRPLQYKYLSYLIIASVLFAWSNFTYILARFWLRPAGTAAIGCSGQLMTNPFTTPCFIGAAIFLVALGAVFLVRFADKPTPAKTV